MKEGLLQLLELQEVDKELKELEEAKDKYPAEIAQRQGEIERATATLRAQEAEQQEVGRRQRSLEGELETARASLKLHEARFAEVTNNREYDALQMEIEACKAKISDCETQILRCIDRGEELEGLIQAEKQDVEEVRQAQQERIDELQQNLDSLQDQVNSVQVRRESVAGQLDPSLRSTYERSRKVLGTRVAALRKGSCGMCFRQLPPQMRSNVRRGSEVNYCESCGAILVWDGESS